MQFVLPQQALVDKTIPKNAFYKNAVVNTKIKDAFVQQIKKITWLYKLAESTLGINKTNQIEEIQIFEVQVKSKELPKKIIQLIDKAIPYHILYVVRYEDYTAYAITYMRDNKKYSYRSDRDQTMNFSFDWYTLEEVYQWLVSRFVQTEERPSWDFESLMVSNIKKEELQRQIKILENKIKQEKQFNRKVVLNNELLQNKKQLDALLNS